MKDNNERGFFYRVWRNIRYRKWERNHKDSHEIYLIQREERKENRKKLRNPFPKGAKSPRVYKFYWSGY